MQTVFGKTLFPCIYTGGEGILSQVSYIMFHEEWNRLNELNQSWH